MRSQGEKVFKGTTIELRAEFKTAAMATRQYSKISV